MNTFTALAADSYTYSIRTDAENASTVFALAGYKSYYSIKPSVSVSGEPAAGLSFSWRVSNI